MKRQDDEYFGGLREQVLERDGYCCRVCGASGRRKRSIVVHHRVPGKSLLHLMISLCPGCHAKVGRTKVVLSQMPPLLLELWREQHPLGHEQTALEFKANFPVAKKAGKAGTSYVSDSAKASFIAPTTTPSSTLSVGAGFGFACAGAAGISAMKLRRTRALMLVRENEPVVDRIG